MWVFMYAYTHVCVCTLPFGGMQHTHRTVYHGYPYWFDVDVDIVGEHNLLDLVGVWIHTPGHGKVERHNNRQQLLCTHNKSIISFQEFAQEGVGVGVQCLLQNFREWNKNFRGNRNPRGGGQLHIKGRESQFLQEGGGWCKSIQRGAKAPPGPPQINPASYNYMYHVGYTCTKPSQECP